MKHETFNSIRKEIKEKAAELDYSEEEAATDLIYDLIYTLDAYFAFSRRNRNGQEVQIKSTLAD